MKNLFLSFLTVLLPMVAFADAVEIDGIYYNLVPESKEAEVTSKPENYYSGSVVIPASVSYKGDEYSVTSIGKYAFQYCSSLTSVTIPNSVTSIRYSAFEKCTSLSTLTIPNSVTSIELYAFIDCTGLSSINIPENMTTIDEGTFYHCASLTSITIPNSVQSINWGAFLRCSSLTTVIIGSSVKEIGTSAFVNCPSLANVYCLAEEVPSIDIYIFDQFTIENALLHVPASAIEAYKAAEPWKNFKDIVALDGTSLETLEYTSSSSRIDIYSIDGKLIGSAADQSEAARIINNLPSGTSTIVRMGGKSVKIMVK